MAKGDRVEWTEEHLQIINRYPEIGVTDISRMVGYSFNAVYNQLLRMGKINIYELYDKQLIDFVAREYATHTNKEIAEACEVSVSVINKIAISLNLKKLVNLEEDGRKLCKECNTWKDKEQFMFYRSGKVNLSSKCEDCRKQRKREYYFEYKAKARLGDQSKRSSRNIYKIENGVEYKQCKSCKEMVRLDDYYSRSSNSDGKVNICKKCKPRKK